MRYQGVDIIKDSTGIRYYRGVKYPRIYPDNNDIYIISTYGDTLDVLAEDYYQNVDDYWIIAIANGLPGDSRFIPAGLQIRMPVNMERIKSDFKKLNNIV